MKIFKFMLAGAAALMMASCSQDADVVAPRDGGNVKVTVSLPEMAGTRSFGDGYTATNLHFAVYDADNGNKFISEGSTTFPANQLQTTVDFQLAFGKSYTIAFFAQSPQSETDKAYTFSGPANTVTVDYAAMGTDYNRDYYDCFFQAYETGVITDQTINSTITLYRPVAQVNWGVSDIDAAMVTDSGAYGANAQYLVSQVQAQAYTVFNMLAKNDAGKVVGGVTGSQTTVTFPYLPRPTGEAFPYEPADYQYVSMQYLLVPATESVVDLTLTVSNRGTTTSPNTGVQEHTMVVPVPNANVQANYRTNIFGSLLTGDLNFTIVKQPAFNTPDKNYPIGE